MHEVHQWFNFQCGVRKSSVFLTLLKYKAPVFIAEYFLERKNFPIHLQLSSSNLFI